jgi:L-arabinose 1-dehydrogenase [NAD(P)+]
VLGSGPGGTAEPIGDVLDRRLAWHLVVPAVHGRLDGLELPVGQPAGRLQSARVLVGLREMEQSARIVEQCLDLNANWPNDDREVQANVPRTTKPEADAEVYRAVEAAKGELGIYIRADGTRSGFPAGTSSAICTWSVGSGDRAASNSAPVGPNPHLSHPPSDGRPMTRIAITGAAGNVGRAALDALSDHDVTPITHREHDDIDGVVLDVADREAFVDALGDQDVLVHLAANPSPDAEWDDLVGPNVEGVYNAYAAAVANDVDRVVFASSNHAVGYYNASDPADPEAAATEGARAVRSDDPPNPDSLYGVTKAAGEAMGAYVACRHGLEVVNLRIGWLMTTDELAATQDDSPEAARFARAMWLSPSDCRNAMDRSVTAPLHESPVTVHVTSRNDDRYLSLTGAVTALGYRPRDNAAEALDREAE